MTRDVAIDSGIDVQTIKVERQEPRKSRIMSAVKAAAIDASRTTSLMDSDTKMDWSNNGVIVSAPGSPALTTGSICFTFLTMSRVEVCPFFSTVRSADRLPS